MFRWKSLTPGQVIIRVRLICIRVGRFSVQTLVALVGLRNLILLKAPAGSQFRMKIK